MEATVTPDGGKSGTHSNSLEDHEQTDSRTSNPRQNPSLLSAAEHPELLIGRCLPVVEAGEMSSRPHLWSPSLSFLTYENLPSIFA